MERPLTAAPYPAFFPATKLPPEYVWHFIHVVRARYRNQVRLYGAVCET